MMLTRWSPVGDLAAQEIERLNRMFSAAFNGEALSDGAWSPAVDIYETANQELVVKVELPEMKREEIKVSYENRVLTIEGERKHASDINQEQYHRLERGYGAFRRRFTLPPTVDGARVNASYQDGVLTVRLPRREDARPRQIEVNGQ